MVMAIDASKLQIVLYPDPVLRQPAASIEQVTDEVRAVAARMIQLMHEAPGVGLAAPQVGLAWRMFVANPTGEPGNDAVYINPTFTDRSRQTAAAEEGCLSLPDIRAQITRPADVTIEATDLDGNVFSHSADGLEARVWQHESDHLDGRLILDLMTSFDRMANRRMIAQLEATGR